MEVVVIQNLTVRQNFGLKSLKQNPLTLIKAPTPRRRPHIIPQTHLFTKAELQEDRLKLQQQKKDLKEKQQKLKQLRKNKWFVATGFLFAGALLSAAVFGITRNTKTVSNVMNKYSSFQETQGVKDSTLYVSGKMGEPLKTANDKIQAGVSNLYKKVSNIKFAEQEKVLKELSDAGFDSGF